MADVTIVAADVRPLPGCIIRPFKAGETLTPGQPVYISAADTVSLADGSAVATAAAIGLVVACPNGAVTAAAGEWVDVVLFGPVAGFSTNMAAGGRFFVDDDAGVIADTTGTKSCLLGIGLSGSVLLVSPILLSIS
jgi:hypothetical protein